jgi:hypothetical protein
MKKYVIAAVMALSVFGFAAFAANLQVNAGVLQAGQNKIGDCAADIAVSYGVPAPPNASGDILYDSVKLTPVDPDTECVGLDVTVFVVDGDLDTLATLTGTFATTEFTVSTTGDGFDANEATDVHVVIRNSTALATP